MLEGCDTMMRFSFCLAFIAVVGTATFSVASDDSNERPLNVSALIEELGSPRFQVREAATSQLLAAGDKVVGALRAVLDDTDRERARRAQIILWKILNEADLGALVGIWDYVSVKVEGKDEDPGGQLTIEPKTIAIRQSTGKEPYGLMPFTIDATKTPKHLDFRHNDSLIRCLYKLEGDSLTLCYSKDSGGARPVSIHSESGSGTRLHVLCRGSK